MGKRQSDVSNTALRIFLTTVGERYDLQRFPDGSRVPFARLSGKYKLIARTEILAYFQNRCCYCAKSLSAADSHFDHVFGINKSEMGLDAWGNVVTSCGGCNAAKNKVRFRSNWKSFLKERMPNIEKRNRQEAVIQGFIRKYGYEQNSVLKLATAANYLYDDIGEIVMALISSRIEQIARSPKFRWLSKTRAGID